VDILIDGFHRRHHFNQRIIVKEDSRKENLPRTAWMIFGELNEEF
jgi:hypothetical protein